MGKKQDQKLYDLLLATIKKNSEPASNPAQNYLTQESLAGAEFLKKGDFSQLPKGMFFDFQMPGEQMKQYKDLINVGAEGTFALGDNGGAGQAMGLAKQYMNDKFARDASLNYQNNIKDASNNIKAGLGQASGYTGANQAQTTSALGGLLGQSPKGFNWGALIGQGIGAGAQIASAFI